MSKKPAPKFKPPTSNFAAPTTSMGLGMGLGMGMGMGINSAVEPMPTTTLDFSTDAGSVLQKEEMKTSHKKIKEVKAVEVRTLNVGKHRLSGTMPMPKLDDLDKYLQTPTEIDPSNPTLSLKALGDEADEKIRLEKLAEGGSYESAYLPDGRPRYVNGQIPKVNEKVYTTDSKGNLKIVHLIKHANRPAIKPGYKGDVNLKIQNWGDLAGGEMKKELGLEEVLTLTYIFISYFVDIFDIFKQRKCPT